MAILLTSLFFAFKISFLSKYRVNDYYYNYKVVLWNIMQLVCIAYIAQILPLTTTIRKLRIVVQFSG